MNFILDIFPNMPSRTMPHKSVRTMSLALIRGVLKHCNIKINLQIRFWLRMIHVPICSYPCYYNHHQFPRKELELINWTDLLSPCCWWDFSLKRVTSPPTRMITLLIRQHWCNFFLLHQLYSNLLLTRMFIVHTEIQQHIIMHNY